MDVVKEAFWDLEKKDELDVENRSKNSQNSAYCLWQLLTILYVICFMGEGVGRYVLFSPRLHGKDKRKGAEREHALGEINKGQDTADN
jgi:hypothetical protein